MAARASGGFPGDGTPIGHRNQGQVDTNAAKGADDGRPAGRKYRSQRPGSGRDGELPAIERSPVAEPSGGGNSGVAGQQAEGRLAVVVVVQDDVSDRPAALGQNFLPPLLGEQPHRKSQPRSGPMTNRMPAYGSSLATVSGRRPQVSRQRRAGAPRAKKAPRSFGAPLIAGVDLFTVASPPSFPGVRTVPRGVVSAASTGQAPRPLLMGMLTLAGRSSSA